MICNILRSPGHRSQTKSNFPSNKNQKDF
uniref:Uncharacterized protein n=1 Tax=Anguilla anguilla TaxID=7936 RepID=A0A0E9QF81_ANGAN